ncbi:MAG: trigger factor [Candidatus Harrisonbacteria bacterium CG10_big_fil_rev_8_21_14_0_10_38_8]|uniref:Trigger factor n=1 Tax=Candidatus Harrisonbacteria bacterium CG10_big_fil_rev_8_21_14_0_10_38_8 TaxID=1974582 RepID=A0A2M6WJD1_9BACT|nr:MAG: trigger factor [Candidatus Harrisonbacteria bacterium CG10_big_fil_rev_8_21_14_0_10_38_8]
MKNKIKKLPGSKLEVEITLSDEEFKVFYEPVLDTALAEVELKGFRKGSAPREMAIQAVNQDKVFNSAVTKAAGKNIEELSQENEWTIIDQPQVEVTDAKDGVTYKVTLSLFPKINIGDYTKIAKDVFSKEEVVAITKEEEDQTIDWLLNSRAKTINVDRGAKLGDLVDIDFNITVDGKDLENAKVTGDRFILGDSKFIQGFDEEIIGKKTKETFEFSLTAPKDFWQKEIQGKKLDFTLTVNEVFEREVPELTDEFAANLSTSFKNIEDMRKSIREGIQMEKTQRVNDKKKINFIEEVSKQMEVDLPEVLVNRMLISLTQQYIQSNPSSNLDHKEAEKQLRAQAEKNVRGHLVLYAIAKQENIKPTQEEIEAEAKGVGLDPEKDYGYLYDKLQNEKVFQFIESLVK